MNVYPDTQWWRSAATQWGTAPWEACAVPVIYCPPGGLFLDTPVGNICQLVSYGHGWRGADIVDLKHDERGSLQLVPIGEIRIAVGHLVYPFWPIDGNVKTLEEMFDLARVRLTQDRLESLANA